MNNMTFEQKLQRIDELIQIINRSNESLEKQIEAYEEGLKLIAECREFLSKTEKKIIDITQKMVNADLQNEVEET